MKEEQDDLTLVYMFGYKNGKDSMKAENERLRAALLKISELEPEGPLGDDCMAVRYASETARAAFEGEKTND